MLLRITITAVLGFLLVPLAQAGPKLPYDPWGSHTEVVSTPLLKQGAKAYTSCASCHLADGGGRPDGAIPRLAGQQATILAEKLARIRRGEVYLPVMAAFANALAPGDVTAVAAYLAALPDPARRGHGEGKTLEVGRATYLGSCAACHGSGGEGNPELFAPRLCGQHYGYLLRRTGEISERRRADANPSMIAVVAAMDRAALFAAADYLSRGDCEPATGVRP